MSLNRRTFLKSSVGSAAGLALTGTGIKSVVASSLEQGIVWTDKMPINPEIDNMRVVCMHDPDMCTTREGSSFTYVNKAVNDGVVRKNMDEMAIALTLKDNADDAWKTIFRSSKEWGSTKVMLKINAVERKMLARVAVIKKIADVLIGFGVLPSNIILFDGQGADWAEYTNFVSLTDDTKIRCVLTNSMDGMGGKVDATVPDITGVGCPKDLIDGTIDIIVNIAVNKGHASPTFGVGLTTLCLKNHYGTFLDYRNWAEPLHKTIGLININKIAPIVGGNPVRQQLCIIDSLWGHKDGPGTSNGLKLEDSASGKPDRLIMGTFAGAVDYCCVKKIREPLQGATHDDKVIPKFLTEFGYTETDPVWVEILPTGTTTGKVNPLPSSRKVTFSLSNPSRRQSNILFSIPSGNMETLKIRVFDIRGSLVTELQSPANAPIINWDGMTSGGRSVGAGSYLVDMTTGNFRTAERLTVLK